MKAQLRNNKFSKPQLLIFTLVFALIGGILIYRSFAASNPNLPGDVNNDNVVDITDLSTILTYFNTTDTRGDADSSGRVDITDLSIVLSHYGSRYTAPTDGFKLVMVTDANSDGLPNFKDVVTFSFTSLSTTPSVKLECFQNGVLVSSETDGFYPDYPWDTNYELGPTYVWTSGSANCTATLNEPIGRKNKITTMNFTVNP
ncbi:hypothetical protein KW803_01720 [Candidatus Saccharibacteria bacterium]|nr:hypothetical protein [Candidatus Saccharibacteria bacterium]